MALKQITQTILHRVEEISGRPMIVRADPAVPMAMVIMARGPAPAHLLKYNPSSEATVDYVVCFQAGFILRKFSTQESERVDLQTSVRGQKEADSLFTQHFKRTGLTLPDPVRAQMYNGLIVQLRSMPIAMRVETWLRRDCPELIDQQKASNARQLNDNATCLLPQVRQLTPTKILHANVAMNAAFARESWPQARVR